MYTVCIAKPGKAHGACIAPCTSNMVRVCLLGEQLEQRHDGTKVAEDPNANAFEVSAEDVAAHRLAIRGRVLHRK